MFTNRGGLRGRDRHERAYGGSWRRKRLGSYLSSRSLELGLVSTHAVAEIELLWLLQYRPLVVWNLRKLVAALLPLLGRLRLLQLHFLRLLGFLRDIEHRLISETGLSRSLANSER